MKIFCLLMCSVGLLFCSCDHKPVANQNSTDKNSTVKDTLYYVYKTIRKRSPDCGSKPDSSCTVATITYPFFTDQNTLNDSVANKIMHLFQWGTLKVNNLDQVADGLVKAYLTDSIALKNHNSYMLDISDSVLRQDSSLTVIQINGFSYSGGAHGAHQTIFFNWDNKQKKQITLNNVLIAGYEPQLTKTGESIFRKDEKLSDNASLADNYFFNKDKFSLNDNFMITPAGLLFLYNEYEIKPYAEGQSRLFIPYSQIKSLLRPNTVVSQYIK